MRTTLGALAILGMVSAGCSDAEGSPGGGGGGGGGGAPGQGGGHAGAPAEGGGGGEQGTEVCNSGFVYPDAERAACLSDSCCDEFNDCTLNGTDVEGCTACFVGGGGPRCDDAIACNVFLCIPEVEAVCDSGIAYTSSELNACLSEYCCDEYRACSADGSDVEACSACLDEGGGALCDDAIACFGQCDMSPPMICDSGIYYREEVVTQCLDRACCDEYLFCTNGGLDTDACIGCLNDGGGPLCDDALLCGSDAGCLEEQVLGICETSVTSGSPGTDVCLSRECCFELDQCVGFAGEASCQQCLNEGGGAACDDLLLCAEAVCSP